MTMIMKTAKRMEKIPASGTIRMLEIAKELEQKGQKIIHFEVGEPDFDTPQHIKDAAIKALNEGFTKYTSSKGIPELREAIATDIKRRTGAEIKTNQIIVTPGAKHAIFCAVQTLINPGDEVLIPVPVWPSYKDIVTMAEGVPKEVPFQEDYSIDDEALKKAITRRTKAIFINTPNNPTGGALTKPEMATIADIARDSKLIIFSDEIYDALTYDGFKNTSILSFPQLQDQTVYIHGFSKTYSMTGWRLGYIAAPQKIVDEMSKIQQNSTTCATSFAQKAAVEAIRGPQDCVEEMRKEYDKRRKAIVKALNQIDGVTCKTPKGAFYAFPNISEYSNDSSQLAEQLLESKGVCITPGKVFGSNGEGHIRISYATSMQDILEGVQKLEEYLHSL
ncbi:MAG: pyridoxal phosphate-dependent aminotransferase [Candidatus Freyarchaeum deiterrae]